MAFLRPLAIHNIQMPGPTYTWQDRQAALYDQLWGPGGASDLYVASLPEEFQAPQVSVGAGDFSFLLKRVGKFNDPQYNFRNQATTQTDVPVNANYLAINPDGDLDEIVDSINVQNGSAATPANQNGSWGTPSVYIASYSFLNVWEFDDAICVISRNGDGSIVGDIMHFGDIIEPEWTDDIDGDGGANDIRVGLAIIAGIPRNGTSTVYAFTSNGTLCCARASLGNDAPVNIFNTSWLRGTAAAFSQPHYVRAKSRGWFPLGPDGVARFCQVDAWIYLGAKLGEFKYLKMLTDTATFSQWQVGVVDYLLCLHYIDDVEGWVHIATTTSYDPVLLGKFT